MFFIIDQLFELSHCCLILTWDAAKALQIDNIKLFESFTVHLIKIGMLTLHQLTLLNRCVMTF